jgi:GNAT superfamily N-acetyltransferase
MSSSIVIRPAVLDDAARISELIRPLAEKFIAHEYSAVGAKNLLGSVTAEQIARRIDEGYRYHVAEEDGTMIGAIGIRDDSHVYHLFVAEGHQSKGIGRRLWETAKDDVRSRTSVERFTVNSSRFAIPFYRRLGFVETGPPQTMNEVLCFPMVRADSNIQRGDKQ